ncbi:hypothetical protein KFK09_005242 [Dendrobium nobile]|uniref:DUF4283 domain-containing protein n=1 Tax=Dendrobium nobile TaxID=94219 RepID=A0A8T3BVB3_DENNO|nr:hypothetical protein KFK09_005242 [Dendrobium nobile]
MEASLNKMDFPPLGPSFEGISASVPKNWSKVFAPDNDAPKSLLFSHHPSEPDIIPFSREKLCKGGEDWDLCLVGYSMGRRPYYEALLGAINKTWSLKGSLKLLSLNDGFFLIRFTCQDDFDMVWSKGVWFLLGKPFVLQKWHPKFTPKKEEFESVPIWVKIHDLPLACWNSEGISRIASKIGVPVAADKLTEQKTRLTYARICFLVDKKATYPEEILVSLDGDVVSLKVQYEWRPHPCDYCKSLMHFSDTCVEKPKSVTEVQKKNTAGTRGRSHSRNARNRTKSRAPNFSRPPPSIAIQKVQQNNDEQTSNHATTSIANALGQPMIFQPHSPTSLNPPSNLANVSGDKHIPVLPNIEDAIVSAIPNMNSPNDEISSSSTSQYLKTSSQPKDIISPNKFDALNLEEENSNNSVDLEILDGKLATNVSGQIKVRRKNKQPQASAAAKKTC